MNNEELCKVLSRDFKFEEAEKYFKEKLPVTKDEFEKLSAKYQKIAFTVAGYTDAEIVNRFYKEVLKAIEEGISLYKFKEDMNGFLEANGYDMASSFQADNIFRTNLQTAYNVGHYEQMTDEDVINLRPYWQYIAVDDDNTRPEHAAMDGLVFRADDPVWDTWYPPNGYRCRCTVKSLSERQLKKLGLDVCNNNITVKPDKGFETNPAKRDFKPDISKFPESIQKAYKDFTKSKK